MCRKNGPFTNVAYYPGQDFGIYHATVNVCVSVCAVCTVCAVIVSFPHIHERNEKRERECREGE